MSSEDESIEIGCLGDAELKEACAIKLQYLDETPLEGWVAMRGKCRELFVGCRRQGRLVGICYGWAAGKERCREGTIVLHGIAMVEEFAGQGYGSRVLRFFEEQVKRAGYGTVSVGSAGGYVDRFYMKNGYKPVAFMVCVPSDRSYRAELRGRYGVMAERVDGDLRRMYVDVSSLDGELRDRLMVEFDAIEVVAIMEKQLATASAADRCDRNVKA